MPKLVQTLRKAVMAKLTAIEIAKAVSTLIQANPTESATAHSIRREGHAPIALVVVFRGAAAVRKAKRALRTEAPWKAIKVKC